MHSFARSSSFLPLLASCLPAVGAFVFELPIFFRNTYASVEVEVGTPGQKHFLRFDTGSATTWMVENSCLDATCPTWNGYPQVGYNISASSTGIDLGTSASIDYLGGVTVGFGVADIFTFPSSPDVEWNQTFLSANTSSFTQDTADGFLGLAFSTIADAGTTTLVETLLQGGQLDESRFAIYYGTEFDNTGNEGDAAGDGVITIGGSEESKYVDGEITWVEPLQQSHGDYQLWRTNMVSFTGKSASGNGSATPISFDSSWAVFDTGAGGIQIPDVHAVAVYESIGMNWTAIIGGDHIPLCTEFTSDWSVSFQFGDYLNPATITLTGDQLALPGFADGSPDYCWPPFNADSNTGLWLFGTRFLHQLYSIFDFGAADVASYQPRVGFGKLNEEYKP